MVIHIKRLFHGFASVRDYQVDACKTKKTPLVIEFQGDMMVIPWNKMDTGMKNDEVFKSKHSDITYSLVDFDWKPNKQQIPLFQ